MIRYLLKTTLLIFSVFLFQEYTYAQSTISGRVSKRDDGKPLEGVTIILKGTKSSTKTSSDGNFSIQAKPKDVLEFKFIGYDEQQVIVADNSFLNIILTSDEQSIDEVVVTGLGAKIDKRLFTGATAKIEMKDVELGGLPDPSRALEGRVAGVIVQNQSGTFGTAPKIRVRGATSIYGSSKPLWVLDGVIIEDVNDISSDQLASGDATTLIGSAVAGLNANDIESFTILKDGSATSIYGARAMGGVIVITTKKGSKGRNSANYVGEYTLRSIPSYSNFNIMNSQEQMAFTQKAENAGWLSISDLAKARNSGIYGKMYDLIKDGDLLQTEESLNAYLRAAEYRNTDWFKELFSNNIMQNHSVSISSGNDKASYYSSLSGVFDKGWTKRSSVQRYTAMYNSSYNLLDNLKLDIRSNGSYRKQDAPGSTRREIDVVRLEVKRDFDINPYAFALNTSRALDPNEFYTRIYAPFNINYELENNYMDITAADLKFQGELKWKPISFIELGLFGAFRYQQASQQHHVKDNSNQALAYRTLPTTFIRDENPLLYKNIDIPYSEKESVLKYGGIYSPQNYKMFTKDFRITASFDKTYNLIHKVYAFAGAETNSLDRNSDEFNGWGMQYEKGEVPFLNYLMYKKLQEENSNNFGISNSRSRQVAFYGTSSYTFDNRYTINGTVRYEGTNRLGKTQSARWMPTWNVSGLWNVSNEAFFKNLNIPVSNLALKASYSLTADRGPASVTNSQIILQNYNPWRPNAVDKESGIQIASLENADLTYEKKKELNLGASVGLFNNRIALDVDVYKRDNYDLIGATTTQGIGGEVIKLGNVASMTSSGIELSLAATLIKNDKFSWVSNFIYAKAKNKITELYSRSRVADLVVSQGFGMSGYPVRSLFSIPFVQINENGLPVFLDKTGNETITKTDPQEREQVGYLKYEGPTDPTDIGSFGNIFTYKNFKFNAFITYSFGNKIRVDQAFSAKYDDFSSNSKALNDAWTLPGDEFITNVPLMLDKRFKRNENDYERAYYAYNYSTETIAKGDFIRLKDVSLSYDLPIQISNKLKMSNLSVRLNVINPWLIYADKKLNGQDPEFVNSGGVALPIARQYTFTLKMNF